MLVQSCHQNQNELAQEGEEGVTTNTTSSTIPAIINSSPQTTSTFITSLPNSTISTKTGSSAVGGENLDKLVGEEDSSPSPSYPTQEDNYLSDAVNNNDGNAQPFGKVSLANANVRCMVRKPLRISDLPSQQHYNNECTENSIVSEFDVVASLKNKISPDPPAPNPTFYNTNKQGNSKSISKVESDFDQGEASSSSSSLLGSWENARSEGLSHSQSVSHFKMSDAYLSGVKGDNMLKNSNLPMMMGGRQGATSAPNTPESLRRHLSRGGRGGVLQPDQMSSSMHVPSDKREKMEYNQMMRSLSERDGRPLSYHGRSASICYEHLPPGVSVGGAVSLVNKRHIMSTGARSRKESVLLNRRSMPAPYMENRYRDKFDVSDLDTNLPRIDLEAIESHLRQAREEERKRRSDREEIRRRLALESDEMGEKPRKHNLHSRLQSSMNLQICFMNETASDSESPNSDSEMKSQEQRVATSLPFVRAPPLVEGAGGEGANGVPLSCEDFVAQQGRLQAEARQALAQAKEMARLQITQERDKRCHSPITEMVRNSLEKVGVGLPGDRRRVSRQLLTEMNVAQLQVIVNDLHSHIEKLNERLVSMLLERDDLHMEQDSMLVDIEDLTRYLAAKYNSPHQSLPLISASQSILGKK